jgi:hypothetical protein
LRTELAEANAVAEEVLSAMSTMKAHAAQVIGYSSMHHHAEHHEHDEDPRLRMRMWHHLCRQMPIIAEIYG